MSLLKDLKKLVEKHEGKECEKPDRYQVVFRDVELRGRSRVEERKFANLHKAETYAKNENSRCAHAGIAHWVEEL